MKITTLLLLTPLINAMDPFQNYPSSPNCRSIADIKYIIDSKINSKIPFTLQRFTFTGVCLGLEGPGIVYEVVDTQSLIPALVKILVEDTIVDCNSLPEVQMTKKISKLSLNTSKFVECTQSGTGIHFIL